MDMAGATETLHRGTRFVGGKLQNGRQRLLAEPSSRKPAGRESARREIRAARRQSRRIESARARAPQVPAAQALRKFCAGRDATPPSTIRRPRCDAAPKKQQIFLLAKICERGAKKWRLGEIESPCVPVRERCASIGTSFSAAGRALSGSASRSDNSIDGLSRLEPARLPRSEKAVRRISCRLTRARAKARLINEGSETCANSMMSTML